MKAWYGVIFAFIASVSCIGCFAPLQRVQRQVPRSNLPTPPELPAFSKLRVHEQLVIGEPIDGERRQVKGLEIRVERVIPPRDKMTIYNEELEDGKQLSYFWYLPRFTVSYKNSTDHVLWVLDRPAISTVEVETGEWFTPGNTLEPIRGAVPPNQKTNVDLVFDVPREVLKSTNYVRLNVYDAPTTVDLKGEPMERSSVSFDFPVKITRKQLEGERIQCVFSNEKALDVDAFVENLKKLDPSLTSCVDTVEFSKRAEFTIMILGKRVRVTNPVISNAKANKTMSQCFSKALRPLQSIKLNNVVAVRCGVRGGCEGSDCE